MSEFAFLVGTRARAPLELPAHLKRQPLCVADLRHVQRHGCNVQKGDLSESYAGTSSDLIHRF